MEAPEATPLPTSIFQPFAEDNANTSAAASCNQTSDFNNLLSSTKDSMMENMGYDGHDVQNQVCNVSIFWFEERFNFWGIFIRGFLLLYPLFDTIKQ